MDIRHVPLIVDEIPIDPRFIDAVKFPLVAEKIRLAERPRLCDGKPIELVFDIDQPVVLFLEALINFAFPTIESATSFRTGQ